MTEKDFKQDKMTLLIMVIATIVIGIMAYALEYAGIFNETIRSIVIVAMLCLFPLWKLTCMITPWLIEYLCSIDNVLAKLIEPKWVTKSIAPASKDHPQSYLNMGITNLGKGILFGFWSLITCIFAGFPGLAESRVDILLHNLFNFWERLLGTVQGSAWMFFYLLTTMGFIYIVVSFLWKAYKNGVALLENKKGKMRDISKYKLIIPMYFILKKIFNYFFFNYTAKMIIEDLIFWWAVTLIIAIIAVIFYLRGKRN